MVKTPDWLKPFWDTLTDILSFLKGSHCPHMIIGGLAVSLIGKPRATQDIDSLILIPEDQMELFFSKAKDFNLSPRIPNAFEFAKKNRVLLLYHEESQIHVDIIFAALPFEEEALNREKKIKIHNLQIPLPTPEDIVIMKAVAHRPRDMGDIEGIFSLHPKLDIKRIRYWVKEFSIVLENPEMVKDLETVYKATLKRMR